MSEDSTLKVTAYKKDDKQDRDRRIEGIRKVLRYQLDLEILYKWREIKLIEEEIKRGEQLKLLIEKLVMNEFVYGDGSSTGTFSSGLSTGLVLDSPPPLRRTSRPVLNSTSSSSKERPSTEPQPQYEVKPDGTIVRMRCPKCGADLFRSMLGFLNHCRIHCRLLFSSQDDRLTKCGVAIDPSEVPPDYFTKHPTIIKQELDLALIRADVLGPVHEKIKKPPLRVTDSLPGSIGDHEQGRRSFSSQKLKGSRFYVKRRIIIGNAAKSLLTKSSKSQKQEGPTKEEYAPLDAEGKEPTHKWRLYIRSPKEISENSAEDVKAFIRSVRFFLHPSYRPNDVVDVTTPPFELVRVGWGEFPVRVQIHFWDPRNRPIEIVHLLKVLTVTLGKYVVTSEQAHDLNLDRRTDFTIRENSNNPSPSGMNLLPSQPSVSDEDILTMAVSDFPLAGRKGKRAQNSNYRPKTSMEEFLRMDLSQQKLLEYQRAMSLCTHLMSVFPTFSMTPEDVVRWCRTKGYTPASVVTFVDALERIDSDASKLLYCRFCGLPHLPQDKFEVLQKNCSSRPRKIHLSTRTSALDLFSRFELCPENNEAFKKLKLECFGSNYVPIVATESKTSPPNDEEEKVEFWVKEKMEELSFPFFSKGPIPRSSILMMTSAMRTFLGHVLEQSVSLIPETKERTPSGKVILTPLHVYRTILAENNMDFLTNARMLSIAAESKKKPKQSAEKDIDSPMA